MNHLRDATEMVAQDALLIAAAPKLLGALESLERASGSKRPHDAPVRVAARQAIQIALGKRGT